MGYHSEGEGYKYFPEKLKWRIQSLDQLLDKEFPEVEARLAQGLAPLEYYDGVEEGSAAYALKKGDIESACWEKVGTQGAFRAAWDAERLTLTCAPSTAKTSRSTRSFI